MQENQKEDVQYGRYSRQKASLATCVAAHKNRSRVRCKPKLKSRQYLLLKDLKSGRLFINAEQDQSEPEAIKAVTVEVVTAGCWIEAKKLLGYELTDQQKTMLVNIRRRSAVKTPMTTSALAEEGVLVGN